MSLSEDMVRLTSTLREAHESRVAGVGAHRVAANQQLADLHSAHRERSATQRKELQQFAETLRRNVADLIHDLESKRASLSAEQRQRLDTFKRDLQNEIATFVRTRSADRSAANSSQRQSLDAFMSALRERTSSFLADVHATRAAIHADQVSARQTWQQFNAEQQQSRAGQSKPSANTESGDGAESQPRRSSKRQPKTPQE